MFRIPKQQVEPTTLGTFSRVVAKRELIHIPLQMLFRCKVIDANNTAFQYRPKALDRVGIDISSYILTRAMIHVVVFE